MDKDVKMTIASTSARRQKTDLHINEPILIRSSSPSPKLAPRVQRTQQYRAALPARNGRLLTRSRAGTPESPLLADGSRASSTAAVSAAGAGTPDDALRIERATHGSMLHDIVTIKTMLLKLKRVLHEPDEGLNLMRTETLNPLDSQRDISPLKNGPSLKLGEMGEASPPPPPPAPHEEVADLRRQLVFLQSQLEERERMVKLLQYQMSKYSEQNSAQNMKCTANSGNEDMCNVATQTERLRPTSQGPNILQSLNSEVPYSGSIVSWNEQCRSIAPSSTLRQSSSSPTPCMKKQTLSLVSSPVSSDCETVSDSKISKTKNGLSKINREFSTTRNINEPVHMKTNCRVGSKYLQAIANKQNGNTYFYGESNGTVKKSIKSKPMYSRSKSIENFANHYTLSTFDDKINSDTKNSQLKSKENSPKHHMSHNNLLNGNAEKKNGHVQSNGCHNNTKNGYTNGNMTDTDDTSDSGYKSLPPSINILIPNKISGIPRKTITSNLRFTQPKQAQTNQC